jgi:hypothetical protein
MVYCIQGLGYLSFFFIWSFWYLIWGRHKKEAFTSKRIDSEETPGIRFTEHQFTVKGRSTWQIASSAAWLKGVIGLTIGYTWYLSLPKTSVAANTG